MFTWEYVRGDNIQRGLCPEGIMFRGEYIGGDYVQNSSTTRYKTFTRALSVKLISVLCNFLLKVSFGGIVRGVTFVMLKMLFCFLYLVCSNSWLQLNNRL